MVATPWAELSEASADLPEVRDYKNAGLFAKKLARALEERGRLQEALAWYEREVLYFEVAGVPEQRPQAWPSSSRPKGRASASTSKANRN